MNSNKELKKNIGIFTAISLVVGSVIGAGVFFKPYAIYSATGGAPGIGMFAWIVGGLASLLAALTFAEIAILIPKTGGMVAYLSEAYNNTTGFLAGWMQTVVFYPAFMASYGVTVGNELGAGLGDEYKLLISMSVILFLVIFNIAGSKTASRVQIVFTICKLIPLFILMIFGLIFGKCESDILTPMVGEGKNIGAVMGSTLLAVLFAFEGWTNVGAIAGEMKNPGRDLPKAIVGGVSIIMFVYLVINIAYLQVIPAKEMMALESPASAVAMKIFGPTGGMLIKVGILVSVIGAANGFLMSGSRVCYQLACDNTLPFSHTLSKLNSNCVPTNSILLIGILGCLYSIGGTFDMLTNLAVFSCWIFYTLTFIAVIIMRKKAPDTKRTYRVPLYPFIPLLAILSGAYVVFSQLFLSGNDARILSFLSIGVTLLGLPVYIMVRKYHKCK